MAAVVVLAATLQPLVVMRNGFAPLMILRAGAPTRACVEAKFSGKAQRLFEEGQAVVERRAAMVALQAAGQAGDPPAAGVAAQSTITSSVQDAAESEGVLPKWVYLLCLGVGLMGKTVLDANGGGGFDAFQLAFQ